MDTLSLIYRACAPPPRTLSPSLNQATIFHPKRSSLLSMASRRRHFWSGNFVARTVKCGAILEVSEKDFGSKVLESDRPVLVEFVATWCGPCRLISSAVEWVAQEYGDKLTVVKIDHDANPQLIEEYKVYGLPTLILFKDGQVVPESRREGAITKAKLKEYVDGLLEQASAA